MGDPRVKAAAKILFDLTTIGLILCTYLLYTFRYMKDYYIYPLSLDFQFQYNGLQAYVHCSYGQFDDNFCGSTETSQAAEVCENRLEMFIAGIVYTVLSCIVLLMCVYSVLHAVSYACVCTCWGTLTHSIIIYIYPPIYVLSVILYIVISKMFSVTTGAETNSDYSVHFGPGFALMILNVVVSLGSVGYYIYARRTGLTAFMDAVGEEEKNDSNPEQLLNPKK